MAEWKIEGLRELNQRFKYLGQDMRFRGGRFALRKAANLVRDEAKVLARRVDDPSTGRVIADNIGVRWSGKHFRRTGDLMFRVGVLGRNRLMGSNPDEGAGGATPHWHLLERGTEKMKAQPFLRPAGENNTQAITAEFTKQYQKSIERALRRVRAGRGR